MAAAGLVGELAEVDLVVVRRRRQHLDVGPGAEHPVQGAGEHDRLDFRMLEAQPLDDVGQLDVDAEVVGVELQLVAVAETAVGVDGHGHGRHRAVAFEAPVPVPGGVTFEGDHRLITGVSLGITSPDPSDT